MENKKKKTKPKNLLGTVVTVLVGVIAGLLMVMYLESIPEDTPPQEKGIILLVFFLGIYAASFIHTVLHEAGHLIFGLISGYKFSSFRVYSFILINENGSLKLRRLNIAGTAGQCLMSPPDMKDGKIPILLYNLGGALVNLFFATVSLVLYFLFDSVKILSPLLLAFLIVGFMMALVNGIPMRLGDIDNDGYNAIALSKKREAVEAFWIQLKIVEQSSRGVRIKDMPKEWFTVPTDEDMKNSMVASRGVFAASRLMDEERFEEADELMIHLLEIDSGIVGLHRRLLMCERIYVELIGETRLDVLRNMLTKEQKQFMKAMRTYPSVIRTEYAIALLMERHKPTAEKKKRDFEKYSKKYPYTHEIESERELMRLVEKKAEEREVK